MLVVKSMFIDPKEIDFLLIQSNNVYEHLLKLKNTRNDIWISYEILKHFMYHMSNKRMDRIILIQFILLAQSAFTRTSELLSNLARTVKVPRIDNYVVLAQIIITIHFVLTIYCDRIVMFIKLPQNSDLYFSNILLVDFRPIYDTKTFQFFELQTLQNQQH